MVSFNRYLIGRGNNRKWKIESEELTTEMQEEREKVNQRKYNVINLDREGRT